MPVFYIAHKGKQILYVNLKDIKDRQSVLDHIEQMVKFYKESSEQILLLLDVRGTFNNPEIMDKLKTYGKQVFAGKSKKRAILGVTGVKKILLSAYSLFTNTDVSAFDDEREAKDYLVA